MSRLLDVGVAPCTGSNEYGSLLTCLQCEVLDALPEYGLLKQRAHVAETVPEQQLELLPGELEHITRLLRHFQHSAAVKDQALGLYVNAKARHLLRPRLCAQWQWQSLPYGDTSRTFRQFCASQQHSGGTGIPNTALPAHVTPALLP